MPITTRIDAARALLLIDASIQAYNAYDSSDPAACGSTAVTPPAGYDFVECWTGIDSYFFGRENQVESFGVVFRSQAAPYTYVFAFRGTYALLDAIEDLAFFEGKDTFMPWGAATPPDSKAAVASGFWSIYSAGTKTTPSMQAQLFALIDKYQRSSQPIGRLLVTGHSLGAALCELFTLDLAFSKYRALPCANYNYACPRVGNSAFVKLYDAQPQQQDAATRTLRVQNTYDIVPCNPPSFWPFDYQHVTDAYLVAFYNKDAGYLNPEAKYYDHQALNYQAVLGCAFASPENVCLDSALYVPADDETLVSLQPDPATLCSWWPERKRAEKPAE